jgi:hypothetical protein
VRERGCKVFGCLVVRVCVVGCVIVARVARCIPESMVGESCGGCIGCCWNSAIGPIGGREDVKELLELKHPHGLAPRREHVMGQMILVILRAVVWPYKLLNRTPHGLDCVCMIPGSRVNKRD